MKKEEFFDLKDEHLQLRQKEVLKGLSTEVKRKLERIMSALDGDLSKKHPVNTEASEMFMSVKVVAGRILNLKSGQLNKAFLKNTRKKNKLLIIN